MILRAAGESTGGPGSDRDITVREPVEWSRVAAAGGVDRANLETILAELKSPIGKIGRMVAWATIREKAWSC